MHYKTASGIQKIASQLRALRIAARLNKLATQAQHEESHKAGTSDKIEFPPPNPYRDILPRAPYKPNPYLQPPPVGGLGKASLPTARPSWPPVLPDQSQVHEETHANGVTPPPAATPRANPPGNDQRAFAWPFWINPTPSPTPRPRPYSDNMA